MTAKAKKLVQESFTKVAPISPMAATLFYNRLFELDPSLRLIFRVNLEEQGRKLMQALTMIVVGLDNLDLTISVIRAMGARHTAYGVIDSHYDAVGSALLWTLEKGLDDEFTPEVEAAWTEVYTLLASEMKAGALRGPVA